MTVLYLVDTESGIATRGNVQGEEQLFQNGDGLYVDGRALYIMQNFAQKIAVVQLSGLIDEIRIYNRIVRP